MKQIENPEPITRTCFLVGPENRLLIGDFTFDKTKPSDVWAKAAFSHARAALKKLMVHLYSISVVDPSGTVDNFPLTKYVKLHDPSEPPKSRKPRKKS